jgi:hypothetical protein
VFRILVIAFYYRRVNAVKIQFKIINIKKIELHTGFCFIYCSCNQDKNLSSETDSTTMGILEWRIPQISEHCGLFLRLFNVIE